MLAQSNDLPGSVAAQLALFAEGSELIKDYCGSTGTALDSKNGLNGFALYSLFRKNPLHVLAYVDLQNC